MTLIATIQDQPNGPAAPDLTQRATRLSFTTNEHGFESGAFSAPLSLLAAFIRYDRAGLPNMLISDGAARAFEGRVEDTTIRGDGIDLTALGYSQALKDVPYTAMWSVTKLDTFAPIWLASTAAGPTTNRKFTIDAATGQINIGLVKNSIYAAGERGQLQYTIPNGSARQISGAQFDYAFLGSANVTLKVSRWNVSATYPYFTYVADVLSLAGTGALQTGSVFTGVAVCDILSFGLETALHNYAGETGAEYVRFSNIRIVTDNQVGAVTTLTLARTNGSPVTCTVGSTANMYVGQRLIISGGGKSESVVVISIPSGTTFTANVVNAPGGGYPIGTNVSAFVIYANQIVKDVLAKTRAVNATQLSAATTLIQSPGRDLLDETYEDRYGADVLDYLAGLGDTQATPRRWAWGVFENQQLFFWPEGTNSRAWYVDISDLELQKTITNLINSVYATYQREDGATLRSAIASNSASVTRYGVTRRTMVEASTTNVTQATTLRDATLADGATPPPRFGITFDRIYNAAGAVVSPWVPRAGDTITIRNLPPTLSVDVDRLRTFRIARTTCDLIARTLTVEPTTPLPSVNALLARAAKESS